MPRAAFFVIMVSLWIGLHVYVGARLIRPLRVSRVARVGLWAGWGLLMLLAPLALATRTMSLPVGASDVLNMAAYIHMGAFMLLVVGSLARDLGALLLRAVDWLLSPRPAAAAEEREAPRRGGAILPTDPSRRAFLQNVANAALVGGVGSLTAVGYHTARGTIPTKPVTIAFPDLPAALDGLRIVQLSDIHIGPTLKADFLEQIVQTTQELEPDLIVITGDLVDGFAEEMAHEVAAFARLQAPLGVFAVTGNHEYYWDAPAWIKTFEGLGLKMLNNAHAVLDVRGASLMVAGVTDLSAGRFIPEHASDPHKARGGADADLKLLLAHQPKSVYEAAAAGFDLQLSGHTHGGQFFPGTLLVGRVHPFSAGLGVYEGMQIYVSRGTGYWGPPLRLGAPPEITHITLRRG